jgi:hypothetical protein
MALRDVLHNEARHTPSPQSGMYTKDSEHYYSDMRDRCIGNADPCCTESQKDVKGTVETGNMRETEQDTQF